MVFTFINHRTAINNVGNALERSACESISGGNEKAEWSRPFPVNVFYFAHSFSTNKAFRKGANHGIFQNTRVRLTRARKSLEPLLLNDVNSGLILFSEGKYIVNPMYDIYSDAEELHRAVISFLVGQKEDVELLRYISNLTLAGAKWIQELDY